MKITDILGIIVIVFLLTSNNVDAQDSNHASCKSTAYEETLVEILKNGLPPTKDPKHIIVIGAGIAGLTGARLLKNAGHKVTILEVSDRAGGRILTYRDPDNKYYVDLGAMRIKYKHMFVNTFVEQFNMSTRPFVGHNKNAWYYINGRKMKVSEVDSNPDILGYGTSPKEKGKSDWDLYEEAMQKVLGECLLCDTLDNVCLRKYDHYSMQNYLVEEVGLSKEAISMLEVTGWDGFMHNALTEAVRDYDWGDFYEIDGGTDVLIQALVPELDNELVYNAKVTRIDHGNGSVVAHYSCMGKDIRVSGDFILTTATPRATSFIKFIPNLNYKKEEAIRSIGFMAATKIVLIFERPFWEDEGIVGGGHTLTDLPSRSIYYPSHAFDSGVGVLLVYTQATQSDVFLGLSDADCLNQTLNDLTQIHGEYIREIYMEGIVKRWSLDPYSHGAFTWFTPYQLKELWAPLVRPTQEIYFAGEHTSFVHAWVDTAIRSAVKAVDCLTTKRCYPELLESDHADISSGQQIYLHINLFIILLPCVSIFYCILY